MLFMLMLGTLLGLAGVTLLRQWAVETMGADEEGPALRPAVFPRLAPPTRQPRYAPGFAPSPYLATVARRRRAA